MENTNNINDDNFKILFEQAPLGYQSLDIDGNFIVVNQKWCDTLGYERDEVIGKWFGHFLTPAYQNGFRERFPVFKAQGHIHSEFEMVHKNGNILFIAFDGRIGYDEAGNFKQTHSILQDVTELRRIEKSLKDALELLKNAAKIAKFGGWNVVLSENRSYWSDEVAAIHEMPAGYCPLVQEGINFYAPEWREKITQVFTDCAQNGIPYDEEMEIITSSGRRVWVRTNGEAVKDDKGNIYKVQGGFQDITERKQAEVELIASKDYLNKIINTVASPIFVKDDKLKFCLVNKALCTLLNLPAEKLIGNTGYENFPKEQNEVFLAKDMEVLSSGKENISEEFLTDGKGDIRTIITRKTLYTDLEGKKFIVGIINDITVLKQNEEKLEKQNDYIKKILDNFPVGIATNEIDSGKVIYINRKFYEIYGWPKEELPDVKSFFEKVFPDMKYRQLMQTRILADLSSGDIERMNWDNLKITTKAGEHRIVNAINIPLKDQNIMVSTVQDITKRKKAEDALKNKVDELNQAINLMIGRELKMVELKEEINELLKQLGKEAKYET